MSIVVAAVTVVAASGTLVQVVRIGHSGAEASWSDVSAVGLRGSRATSAEPDADRPADGAGEGARDVTLVIVGRALDRRDPVLDLH